MPTYVYKFIDTDETIEVQQSFSDATLTEYTHPESGAPMPVKKVFLPVGVTFKGDGFYKTDSRSATKKKTTDSSGGDATKSDSSKSESSKTESSKSESSKSDSSKSDSSKSASSSKSDSSKSTTSSSSSSSGD